MQDYSKENIERIIKNKFYPNKISEMEMLRGKKIEIELVESGVIAKSLPKFVMKWEMFEAILNKAKDNGGIMFKGDSAAQGGYLLGSPELSLETIDGLIAYEFLNIKPGTKITRRSTYFAGVLNWANLAKNCRNKGEGGYIELVN